MSTTLSQFEAEILPLVRDTTGGRVTTTVIRDSLNRCIRNVLKKHGMYSTIKSTSMDFFDTIYEYPLATDFYDFISLAKNGVTQEFIKTKPSSFSGISGNVLALNSYKSINTLLARINATPSSLLMNGCESTAANGTWAVVSGTDALSIGTETTNHVQGSGAVSFNVTVGNSVNDYAEIECTGMTSLDLTDYANKGTVFLDVYIPSVTNFTSITLYFGNDSSNYYSKTITTQYNGLALVAGYNIIGFSWGTASETGTVTDTAIDYIKLRFTYTSSYTSQVGFIIDNIRIANPYKMDLTYYSTHFVADSTGATKEEFESASDVSLLNDVDNPVLFFYALGDAFWVLREYQDKENAEARFREEFDAMRVRIGSEKKREVIFYR